MCVTDWWAKVTLEGISGRQVGMVIWTSRPWPQRKEKLQTEATTGSFKVGGDVKNGFCCCYLHWRWEERAFCLLLCWTSAFQTRVRTESLLRLAVRCWSAQLWERRVEAGRVRKYPTDANCGGSWRLCCGRVFKWLLRPWPPSESVGEEEHMADRVWEHVLVCKGPGESGNKTGRELGRQWEVQSLLWM